MAFCIVLESSILYFFPKWPYSIFCLWLQASTDQSELDMNLPALVWAITLNLIQLLGNIVVISQAVWQVFIVLVPVMAACIWYQVVL